MSILNLKRPSLILFLSLFIFPLTNYASSYIGDCRISNQTLNSLSCSGDAAISHATITGDVTINGPAQITQSTIIGNLTVHGPLKIDQSVVKKQIEVTGPTMLDSVTLSSIDVKGPLKIINSTIFRSTSVKGSIDAINTTFNAPIVAIANTVKLEQSTIHGNLLITSSESPYVSLKGSSMVNGDIIFKQSSGTVVIKDKSSHSGNVKNGSSIVETDSDTAQ